MIKVDNTDVECSGSAVELTKEWAILTYALCKKLSEATGHNVTVDLLVSSSRELLDNA